MAKDDKIARFVYRAAPNTYANTRFSDWIRPYLETKRNDTEKNATYAYMKSKYETIIMSLKFLTMYEQKCDQYRLEDQAQLQKLRAEGGFAGLEEDWLVG